MFIVDEFATERIALPPFDVDWNNVGMTHQEQCRRGWIGAFDAGDEIPASRLRFVRFNVETAGPEVLREYIDTARFMT
jgi:hypothetical protein